jgi:hypothetical protein
VNDEGGRLDFHSLRRTCGAWLAMTGAHPKAVEAIMRHSRIVVTMDTYGHLLRGQEADTVAKLPAMLGEGPKQLRATGALGKRDKAAKSAERWVQRATRKPFRGPCDTVRDNDRERQVGARAKSFCGCPLWR